MRGFLTEQGSKRLSKEDLWTLRQRLLQAPADRAHPGRAADGDAGRGAATSRGACLPLEGSEEYAGAPACVRLRSVTAGLAGFYGAVADEMRRRRARQLAPVPAAAAMGGAGRCRRHEPGERPVDAAAAGGHRARAPAAAPAPALGPGAPAPPQRQRPDGERAGAAAGRDPPASLVAVALPCYRTSLTVALVNRVTHAGLPGRRTAGAAGAVRELLVRPGRSNNIGYGQ